MVKIFLEIDFLTMWALHFNDRENPSSELETKSLTCSMNRDKKAHPYHSKNGGRKRSIWIIGLMCDHPDTSPLYTRETFIVYRQLKKEYY